MEILPEPEWEVLLEKLKNQKCTVLLLGTTDSGKSTLAKYFIEHLLEKNISVSLVDSDVGQSILGLPGTISMKVFSKGSDLDNFRFERMFFVGSTNPAKKISLMIDGTKRMVDICRERSDIIVVDTTGLISGEIGRSLKLAKIRAIKPEYVLATQRHDELEHILTLVEGSSIYRIRPSPIVKGRDREDRIKYRKKKFYEYFCETETSDFLLQQNDVGFFCNGKPISLKNGDFRDGTIISLNHSEDSIALGVIVEITVNTITFKSPIQSLKGINRVLFGDITI